jgi:hypothetical protein
MECINRIDLAFYKESENRCTFMGYHPAYKIGVTNDIKKRIAFYKKNGYEMKIIKLWKSIGSHAKCIEDLFFKEMITPFDRDDIRWGSKIEWFCDKKDTCYRFSQKSTLKKVINFIDDFLINNRTNAINFDDDFEGVVSGCKKITRKWYSLVVV